MPRRKKKKLYQVVLKIGIFSSKTSPEIMEAAQKFVDEQLAVHKVVVFSKSYCPYCKMAKEALKEIKADYHLIEIENRSDCDAIQDVLSKMTGARSVPRVFINKKCIGGGSETKAMKQSGELQKLIAA